MSKKQHVRTVIEPFIIKSVQPIRMTTRLERERVVKEAHYNLFKVSARDVLIDLLTRRAARGP